MIETFLHEDVLEIVISNPPVNAIGPSVRVGVTAAIIKASADPSVTAIVIIGDGKLFSAGADITEFDKPLSNPTLPDMIDQIEASSKPVIAALHGTALGGGLEIALGCHYRVAAAGTMLGLPEVLLGILPGAGGTQRLPRLVGVEAALEMIVSGSPISAEKAIEIGLVDHLASANQLANDAIAYAKTCKSPRRTSERSVSAQPDVFKRFVAAKARKIRGLDAPQACIEAVEAAVRLPFAQGLAKERALCSALIDGKQAAALQHVFFAERAASKIAGLPSDTPLRPISRVGVLGAGTMGGGISMNFLLAGIPVTIVETHQASLDQGVGILRKNFEASVAKGRLTAEQVAMALDLLSPTLAFNDLKDCDLIIEAVYEDMDLKKEIFARLDAIAKPGAILASNTSFLSLDEMASATSRPQDVLGLHFFSPANVMKLLEVVRGAKTSEAVLATGMSLARRINKVPVVSGMCYGFIGNRMLLPRQINAEALLIEGASPEQVDTIHTDLGMPMGPFQMADLSGLDIGWHRDPKRVETLRDALCAEGRWGQKTKAGYYDYDDKRQATPSPDLERIIDRFRTGAGVVAREISDEEITARTLYTMVNEGAKILEEDIAQRASDIDVVWTYGYGWPRHEGGPMFWANRVGLQAIVDGLRKHAARLGPDFTLSPLLLRCAEQGTPLEK